MNRVKRRALKAINRKLAKVAKKLRAQEPEWEPGAVSEPEYDMYEKAKMGAMIAQIEQLTGRDDSDILEAVNRVQERWGVTGLASGALNHLLKLAKRGEWE